VRGSPAMRERNDRRLEREPLDVIKIWPDVPCSSFLPALPTVGSQYGAPVRLFMLHHRGRLQSMSSIEHDRDKKAAVD
jgi:hypothetical protein